MRKESLRKLRNEGVLGLVEGELWIGNGFKTESIWFRLVEEIHHVDLNLSIVSRVLETRIHRS